MRKETAEYYSKKRKEYLQYKEDFRKRRRLRLIFFVLITVIYIIIVLLMLTKDTYVDKRNIKDNIITAINNSANLDVIKNIYDNRVKIQVSIEKFYKTFYSKNYYSYNTPLSQILNDIESDFYLSNSSTQIDINKTRIIIDSYQYNNPFDSLEESQKDIFNNINLKFSNNKEEYMLIYSDLEKIAKELSEKNSLVNEYLKDSTNSFWISISALIFSAILGLVQLYLGREERQRKIISDEVNKNNFDSDDEIPF